VFFVQPCRSKLITGIMPTITSAVSSSRDGLIHRQRDTIIMITYL
jgi:hypothetical protein